MTGAIQAQLGPYKQIAISPLATARSTLEFKRPFRARYLKANEYQGQSYFTMLGGYTPASLFYMEGDFSGETLVAVNEMRLRSTMVTGLGAAQNGIIRRTLSSVTNTIYQSIIVGYVSLFTPKNLVCEIVTPSGEVLGTFTASVASGVDWHVDQEAGFDWDTKSWKQSSLTGMRLRVHIPGELSPGDTVDIGILDAGEWANGIPSSTYLYQSLIWYVTGDFPGGTIGFPVDAGWVRLPPGKYTFYSAQSGSLLIEELDEQGRSYLPGELQP